jgi:hypothetical protein
VVDEPEEQTEGEAHDETSDNRKIKRGVFAAMNDVAGKAAESKWEFAAEEEKSADEKEHRSKDKQSPAKFAKVHEISLAAVQSA